MKVPDDQLRGFIGNRMPSRERIDDLNRLALFIEDEPEGGEDAALLREFADLMLEIRQAVRGGKLYHPAGDRWDPNV